MGGGENLWPCGCARATRDAAILSLFQASQAQNVGNVVDDVADDHDCDEGLADNGWQHQSSLV